MSNFENGDRVDIALSDGVFAGFVVGLNSKGMIVVEYKNKIGVTKYKSVSDEHLKLIC